MIPHKENRRFFEPLPIEKDKSSPSSGRTPLWPSVSDMAANVSGVPDVRPA
jgi:hypothetical protein